MEFFNPNSNIPFMRWRKYTLPLAVLLMLGSAFMIFGRGLNYGLDFTGGVLVEVSYQKPVDIADARAALEKAGIDGAMVQAVGGTHELAVRLQPKQVAGDAANDKASSDRVADEVMKALKASRPDATQKRHDFVGPKVGAQLRNDGTLAGVFVIIGIVLYLAFRYERRFGFAVLLNQVHDALVTVGIIALMGREFDMTVLASVLAVIGYSVNDTVVVFDRVRELFRLSRKAEPVDIMNRAVNNTLSRTIVTSMTTAISMAALYFFGGPAVEGFAATMLVGIVLGTLSSIFIACPLLLLFGVSKKDLMPVARNNPELARRP